MSDIECWQWRVNDNDGVASFFEEELTGQNNALLAEYSPFTDNRQLAFTHQAYSERSVTVRLDTLLCTRDLRADLVKIDIEGAGYPPWRERASCLPASGRC